MIGVTTDFLLNKKVFFISKNPSNNKMSIMAAIFLKILLFLSACYFEIFATDKVYRLKNHVGISLLYSYGVGEARWPPTLVPWP